MTHAPPPPPHSMCNKLGKGRPRLETGATDDGLSGFSKNRHNPVMVYNDLMIRNITVHNYNKDRSQLGLWHRSTDAGRPG